MTATGRRTEIIDSPAAVRRINRARVLEIIRVEGPLTRPDAVRLSGKSTANLM